MRFYATTLQPILLRVTEAARMIGFSRTKTYELVQAGKIPSIVIEGRLRVPRQALLDWIEEQGRSTARG